MWYLGVTLAAVVVAVVLILLATMREVALLQEKISVYRQLLLRPARPSYIGERLPLSLADALARIDGLSSTERALLIFMRPDCSACQEMSVKLPSMLQALGEIKAVVVVGRGPRGQRMLDRAAAAEVIAEPDPAEVLFDAAEIRSTPTMILVDLRNQIAEDYAEGSDLEWLRSLHARAADTPTPIETPSRSSHLG